MGHTSKSSFCGQKKGIFYGRELSFSDLFDSSVHRNGPFRGRKAVNDASIHENAGFGG